MVDLAEANFEMLATRIPERSIDQHLGFGSNKERGSGAMIAKSHHEYLHRHRVGNVLLATDRNVAVNSVVLTQLNELNRIRQNLESEFPFLSSSSIYRYTNKLILPCCHCPHS